MSSFRRTNNPKFINVPLTNGTEYTLNLSSYDPSTVEKRKGFLRVKLRSAQVINLAIDKEELDEAYSRYQTHAAATEGSK